MTKKYETGLVLSGGGARGFAHLGVVAALHEMGIRPDVISGVSAGAIAGAFIAAGKSPQEVLKTFKKGRFFKFTKIHLPVDGLLKLDGVKELLDKEIGIENIEDLPLPLHIAVSNLNKGIVEYKNSGPLAQTVLASSSIPVLFSPVQLGNYQYVDGGLLDNLPIAPIQKDCAQLIVSNISPINPREKLKNLVQIAIRTVYMSVNVKLNDVKKVASYYIEPRDIDVYDLLQLKNADQLYRLGYQSTMEVLNETGKTLGT